MTFQAPENEAPAMQEENDWRYLAIEWPDHAKAALPLVELQQVVTSCSNSRLWRPRHEPIGRFAIPFDGNVGRGPTDAQSRVREKIGQSGIKACGHAAEAGESSREPRNRKPS
jgi:hypothetical protein